MPVISGLKKGRMQTLPLVAVLILCSTMFVSAQQNQEPPASSQQSPHMIERIVAVEAGKVVRIGAYFNVQSNCTSGPVPILRLAEPPQGGRVVIKRANIRVTNAGACLSAEVPGYVAFYQSRPDFSGTDKVAIEIRLPNRGTAINIQRITINVRAAGIIDL
jgi:hypothetical protein